MAMGSSSTATRSTVEPATLSPGPQHLGLFITYRIDSLYVTSPIVYYGIPLVQAVVIAALAFTVLDGTVRLAALGVAVLDVLIAPQILKRAL